MLTEKTINILKEKAAFYKVKKLLLFGSCLHKPEEEANDIDLLVEIDRINYLPLGSDLFWDEDINKSIDLIDMSSDIPMMPAILEDAVVIYEAQDY